MKQHRYIYSSVVIFAIWFTLSLLLKLNYIPSPVATIVYIGQHINEIFAHVSMSLYRIMIAMILTILLGTWCGVMTARVDVMDRSLTPLFYTLYPIPKIAFLPILMLLLGIGNASKIALVSLILFFQIVITIRDSVKNIHPSYYLSIKSLGASKSDIYRHVIIPAMLPSLFTALRLSVGTSISVLFFAENYATQLGIGYFIMDSWLKINYTAMFAGVVVISLMGSLIFAALDMLESKICNWV